MVDVEIELWKLEAFLWTEGHGAVSRNASVSTTFIFSKHGSFTRVF